MALSRAEPRFQRSGCFPADERRALPGLVRIGPSALASRARRHHHQEPRSDFVSRRSGRQLQLLQM